MKDDDKFFDERSVEAYQEIWGKPKRKSTLPNTGCLFPTLRMLVLALSVIGIICF